MKRKKIFKILSITVCLIIISALFLVPASADNFDSRVTRIMYGGSSLSYDVWEWGIEELCVDHFLVYSTLDSFRDVNAHFYISPKMDFVVGDVVNISGTLVLSHNAKSVSIRNVSDYNSTKDLSSSLTYYMCDSGVAMYLCPFSYSYTYKGSTTDEFRFSVTDKTAGTLMLGFYDFTFNVKNDPSVSAQAQTDALKQNQDKNTDKLLNGGHSSAPYGSTDKSSLEQNDKLSSDVDSATLEARSSTISFFNNFSSLITSSGGLHRGLLAISKVFTEFFSISWLSNIVKFGLAIGSFAFVIGSVTMIVGKVSSDKGSNQRKTNYDRNISRRK